ncbi:CORD and CS domain protein [Aaosphaeria arxii CBS 175.79]|uniref:CORD and CS domain protein n=1 Tax=Aaosphaeria arxii CBS 175.79 TaxID=1450172 RepID=A0A6A5Y295_9PLEO|nr:CORD and CS domain protein [Aaosphaeria arxii CBS 175.79]KAF2018694.1 CORD and CS domain protein [Aaosphaeria arxii CBS 175.79]
MAKKCVHKGCGKTYENEDEACVYHPGPPVFHEGQKGWKCCEPRVLTFDEFLNIEPCTTGKHSEIDDTPAPEPTKNATTEVPNDTPVSLGSLEEALPAPVPRLPTNTTQTATAKPPASPAPPPEDEDDDPSLPIPEGQSCKRKGCGQSYSGDSSRSGENCVHHPGVAVFHEGSKGWSCCKRRVLEFDEFMRIEGCKAKDKHLFVGSAKKAGEEKLDSVRHDYYQTGTTVTASLYLKKIDKEAAIVEFKQTNVNLDLPTTDSKRYRSDFPLYAAIKPAESKFRILGTKLELTLVKADGTSWPVLRSDDRPTGEMIQVGRAGRV